MRPVLIAIGAFLAMLTAAPAAHAQLSENGGPVSYSANTLEYFDGDRRLVLTGDVDIIQNDARLRADKITLYFTPVAAQQQQQPQQRAPQQPQQQQPPQQSHAPVQGLGSGDIQRMLAEGDVYYVRPQQSARGNNAVYDVNGDSVTFTGNVVVASDENVIRGETMVLHIKSRQTTIAPTPGQRVRGVFVPQNQQGQTGGPTGATSVHPGQTPASPPAAGTHH